MPIQVTCPQCGSSLQAPDGMAGKSTSCPKCHGKIEVPGDGEFRMSPLTPAVPATIARPDPPPRPGMPPLPATAAPSPAMPAMPAGPPAIPARPTAGVPVAPIPAMPVARPAMPVARPAMTVATAADDLATPGSDFQPRGQRDRRGPNYAVIGGVAAVALLLIGGLVWALTSGALSGGGGGSVASALKFLPDNPIAIVKLDVNGFLKSDTGSTTKKEIPDFDAQMNALMKQMLGDVKITLDDIDNATLGMIDDKNAVAVIRLKKAMKPGDFAAPDDPLKEEKVGNYTLHSNFKSALWMPDDRTVVGGNLTAAEPLKAIMKRDAAMKPSPVLQKALDACDSGATISAAVGLKGSAAANQPLPPGIPIALDKIESLSISASAGSEIKVSAKLICSDEETAKGLVGMANFGIMAAKSDTNMPPDVKKFFDSLSIAQSGGNVDVSMRIDNALIAQGVRQAQSMDGGGARPGPGIRSGRPPF